MRQLPESLFFGPRFFNLGTQSYPTGTVGIVEVFIDDAEPSLSFLAVAEVSLRSLEEFFFLLSKSEGGYFFLGERFVGEEMSEFEVVEGGTELIGVD